MSFIKRILTYENGKFFDPVLDCFYVFEFLSLLNNMRAKIGSELFRPYY